MNEIRVIPRLDIKGPNLVKGIHLEGLRVLGRPEAFARHYYEHGADELVYMDVVASLYGRNSLLDIVSRTSREVFIPLAVGGGLRTLDDIQAVLRAGADKVSLNTAAIQNPQLIREAATRFGSSTILISIEAIRQPDGRYEAFTDNGREATGVDVYEWAVRVAELGAGEIMITSVDREGTGKGFDIELTRRVARSVPIPVIACGGAGKAADVADAIVDGAADAVSIASILHYGIARELAASTHEGEGNTEFLRSGLTYSRIHGTTIPAVKAELVARGIPCRV
ncbi:MAG: imidazole glycerol phosphate synthase subunit HisF [Acidobacteria bacterium]|nr:MAG: imidazole glycerol phosphate synthase subunit HisF [Acidobacteriota bacterium]